MVLSQCAGMITSVSTFLAPERDRPAFNLAQGLPSIGLRRVFVRAVGLTLALLGPFLAARRIEQRGRQRCRANRGTGERGLAGPTGLGSFQSGFSGLSVMIVPMRIGWARKRKAWNQESSARRSSRQSPPPPPPSRGDQVRARAGALAADEVAVGRVEAQRSPGGTLSGFIARQAEQPGSRHSNPAARKIWSSPSASACAFDQPGAGNDDGPAHVGGLGPALEHGGGGAQVFDPAVGARCR
jgi:hypothetical protein